MVQKWLLTNSRFKLATEFPTKLPYTKKAESSAQYFDASFLLTERSVKENWLSSPLPCVGVVASCIWRMLQYHTEDGQ